MPQMGLRESFELETRNRYTKVNCEVGLKIDGRELPNMAILGEALEKAIEMIQEHVKQAYVELPERHGDTPLEKPIGAPPVIATSATTTEPAPPKF